MKEILIYFESLEQIMRKEGLEKLRLTEHTKCKSDKRTQLAK